MNYSNKIYMVAELSANHNQQIDIALKTIKAAKESGADAIKLQTYTPDTLTIDCDKEWFRISNGTIWDGRNLYDLYKEASIPWEWHNILIEYAKEIGIDIFSTPFDKTSVDFLEAFNMPAYKIASFEITDIPFIEYVASKNRPMIISTGIAGIQEIEDAVNACRKNGNDDITLLQCTSQYPAQITDANLLTMVDMKERFHVNIGLSDHTIGHEVAVVASALGATLIEKHFILDRAIGGPDASFSMTPDEFQRMVEEVRKTEIILGDVNYDLEKKKSGRTFARSLFVVKDVCKGDIVTEENIRSIRPGHGLSPKYYYDVLGKKFLCDVSRGTPLSLDIIK